MVCACGSERMAQRARNIDLACGSVRSARVNMASRNSCVFKSQGLRVHNKLRSALGFSPVGTRATRLAKAIDAAVATRLGTFATNVPQRAIRYTHNTLISLTCLPQTRIVLVCGTCGSPLTAFCALLQVVAACGTVWGYQWLTGCIYRLPQTRIIPVCGSPMYKESAQLVNTCALPLQFAAGSVQSTHRPKQLQRIVTMETILVDIKTRIDTIRSMECRHGWDAAILDSLKKHGLTSQALERIFEDIEDACDAL